MKSANSCRLLDLERDLPTTPEDILAMRRARESQPLNLAAYLEFLASFPPPSIAALRARKGPAGVKPFEL
jgi:hypothetical protein